MSERATTERRAALRDALRGAILTVQGAWEWGHARGFYEGGDGPLVKADLNAVGRRHPGFWRAMTADERARAYKWADYWTTR